MDIVYLFKEDPGNNSEELRYSLRSLKNIPHNKVFIVGEKPAWAVNVEYIPVPQSGTKRQNVKRNRYAAVNSELLSDDFILMNDDFFFMKPISSMPTLNFGRIEDVLRQYNDRYPEGSDYIATMTQQYDMLRERGFTDPMSYELHMPMVLNKHKVRRIHQETDVLPPQFRTYYGNLYAIGGETVPDVKVFLEPAHNDPAYTSNPAGYLEAQTFLSATGGSFKRGLPGEFVRSRFPEKSQYEL